MTRDQRRLGRRLEEVAKAVGGGYCRLQMPLRLALGVRGTVAGHRLGALGGGGGGNSPPSNASLPHFSNGVRPFQNSPCLWLFRGRRVPLAPHGHRRALPSALCIAGP